MTQLQGGEYNYKQESIFFCYLSFDSKLLTASCYVESSITEDSNTERTFNGTRVSTIYIFSYVHYPSDFSGLG